jgi:hypothetical protein
MISLCRQLARRGVRRSVVRLVPCRCGWGFCGCCAQRVAFGRAADLAGLQRCGRGKSPGESTGNPACDGAPRSRRCHSSLQGRAPGYLAVRQRFCPSRMASLSTPSASVARGAGRTARPARPPRLRRPGASGDSKPSHESGPRHRVLSRRRQPPPHLRTSHRQAWPPDAPASCSCCWRRPRQPASLPPGRPTAGAAAAAAAGSCWGSAGRASPPLGATTARAAARCVRRPNPAALAGAPPRRPCAQAAPAPPQIKRFVTRAGAQLQLEGQPFYFLGMNAYWLADMGYEVRRSALLRRTHTHTTHTTPHHTHALTPTSPCTRPPTNARAGPGLRRRGPPVRGGGGAGPGRGAHLGHELRHAPGAGCGAPGAGRAGCSPRGRPSCAQRRRLWRWRPCCSGALIACGWAPDGRRRSTRRRPSSPPALPRLPLQACTTSSASAVWTMWWRRRGGTACGWCCAWATSGTRTRQRPTTSCAGRTRVLLGALLGAQCCSATGLV